MKTHRILQDINTYLVITLIILLYHFGDSLFHQNVWPTLLHFIQDVSPTLKFDDALVLVIIAHIILECVFWGICSLLLILDRIGILESYRLQPIPANNKNAMEDKIHYYQHTMEAFKDVLFSHYVIRPPFLYIFFKLVVTQVCPPLDSPIPSFKILIPQFLGCMFIDDMWFYWAHRAAHLPIFYATIHKKHHSFHRPNVFATEYAHPLEDIFVNQLGTVSGPVLLQTHPVVLIFYVATKLYQSMEAHSGFNLPFPLSIWSVIDSMDCAPAHDFHHSHNIGNFGGFFMFWDWICGTDLRYKEFVMNKKKDVKVYESSRRPYT
jgi:sterol desaturase/sphingolipid hydroxylase (fatty acid hydroxylase superfamily)